MARGVNFLNVQHRKATVQEKLDRQWFRYSLYGVGVLTGVIIILAGVFFFLQYQIGQVEARTQALEREVLASEEVEKSALVLAKKLSILETLFDERQDKQQAIEYFTNLLGSNIVIKEINYQQTEGILSLRVQSGSVFDLERVFGLVQSDQTKQLYGTIATSDLRRDQIGIYTLNITINLAQAPQAS